MWLCRLPGLPEIIVEDAEAGDDEAIVLAFLPRELCQRHGVAAAIGQCNGFEIETTRRVRAGWLWFLRQQQVLPPATHRVQGRSLLLGELLLGVVLLRRWQLQDATCVPHDRGPGELLADHVLDIFESRLIGRQECE